MNKTRQAATISIKLELYIKESELSFLTNLARELSKQEVLADARCLHKEVTIQDVIRSLIRARMRDADAKSTG